MILRLLASAAALAGAVTATSAAQVSFYQLPQGAFPHDVAPAPDGTVWFSGQQQGFAGRFDPTTGKLEKIPLGRGAAPHGVVIGPDGAAWLTEGGQNAIARVDPATKAVKLFPLPAQFPRANLNTLVFDKNGLVWFTGQSGVHGRVDPISGKVDAWAEPPRKGVGPRRIWSDSQGMLWVSFWNAGGIGRYDPAKKTWTRFPMPQSKSSTYSVYVDDKDRVWATDWVANAIQRFDPVTERYETFPSDKRGASVRQMLGRPGEAWGGESGTDRLVVVRD
jgi:virginiamycin B lyase